MGMKAWAGHINDNGGVHGRKIEVILKDDAYNPTRALANLQEMKGNVFAVCGLLGTAILNAAKDFFAENQIPLITAYGDVRISAKLPKDKQRYVFIAYSDYEDEADYLSKYAVEKLESKKIAVFYQNDDYGKMALSGVEKGLKESGKGELAGAVPYEVTERALATHALKLKETGADTVILYPTMTHGALIIKEMAKLAFTPKTLVTFTLGDPIMYNVAGEPWEGTYIALPGNSGVPGSEPAADKVVEILLKYDSKLKGKEYVALFGAVSMMHLVEGMKNAGKDLTPETMISGMERIKDWKPEGIGAPVTYAPDRRHGVNASRMGQARQGKHVPITEFTIFKPRF
jgi:ABC-type branched-subunit amino acid transport system substrate-binding protein